ncbi:MAG: mechanosensitive ion channel [Bacteroidetes bacterium]|nr:mechanosensitive ion channel [Bacteroidota bacterium]
MSAICRVKSFLLVFFFSLSIATIAQRTDSSAQITNSDTSFSNKLRAVKKIAAGEALDAFQTFNAGRIAIRQQRIIEEIQKEVRQAKAYLKKGIDTSGISRELVSNQASLNIAGNGILYNAEAIQTQRNLTVSSNILSKLIADISERKNILDKYTNELAGFRERIDSLNSDTVVYSLPADSASLVRYIKKLRVIMREIGPVDTAINQALVNLTNLQNQVDLLVVELKAAAEEIDGYRKRLSSRTFEREFSNIWETPSDEHSFSDILHFSIIKERLAIKSYLRENIFRIFIIVILIVVATAFIRSLKRRVPVENTSGNMRSEKLILRYPFLSAVVIVVSLFQFIFIDPPFIFGFCLWFISVLSLAVIFRNFITVYWFRFWLVLTALFILASADNLVLQASRFERLLMLAMSFFGAIYGTFILLRGHRLEMFEKRILYFVAFLTLAETASFVFNIYGRYNFSKTLLTIGFIGVVIAISFLWAIRLINEGLVLASQVYKHPDKRFLYINFERVGDRVPGFLYILVIVGWFILVAKNFYEFKQVSDPFNEFLTRERTIGDYTFSVNGLFLFLVILFCSVTLSRVVSFFTSEPDETRPASGKTKIAAGSWILLIRIFIITIGLYLAFAATGISLDRITIVIGALGVGIGLGLQGLVNNLVSGLIIAFEKPVNVGDIIEIQGKFGTMKSIGFRSSVVTMVDGSCTIIPNGEILNKEMINWTTGKNIRRMTVTVGVAYGTDLMLTKKILEEILGNDDRILKYPASVVIIKEFNQSSVDFDIMFWVKDIRQSLVTKSDVISRVDIAFKQNKIVIPFQQRDVHVYPVTDASLKKDVN